MTIDGSSQTIEILLETGSSQSHKATLYCHKDICERQLLKN